MKKLYVLPKNGYIAILGLISFLLSHPATVSAQSCPTSSITSISSYPNTYYPANQTNVTVGSTTIALGAVTYGSTPISANDILLIIQMQGAQIVSNNDNSYGDNSGSGSGYRNNNGLMAGNMEYVVATNSVPLTGGSLTISTGTVHAYKNAPPNTYGQYTYQVIRVPVYYDLLLTSTITTPAWDGKEGGVLVLYATNKIDMNWQTIDASGAGFRGGGGRGLTGQSGAYYNTDYITMSTANTNGSKGEGLAGTPKYINQNYTMLVTNAYEGYPYGSYAMGAPGNAGGGGTDGNPGSNDQNTGGGGGGNGGYGGVGGWAWSSADQTGGRPGAVFAQASASRLVLGGGGGAGTTNNFTGVPVNGLASSGASGGGMIILYAGLVIKGTGTILANGANGNSTVQNDGAGGAGAGGSIVLYSANGNTSNMTVQANGGAGGSNELGGGPSHGPGGGGGGGVIFSNGPLSAASSVNGGSPGTTAGNSYSFGASAGATGSMTTTLTQGQLPTFPLSCIILPVNFLSLTATPGNGTVNLQWEVSGEVNTVDYMIERSTDGTHFNTIGSTPYKAGNATDNTYQYGDEGASAIGGMIYYRIRESESDGASAYSKIVSVQLNSPTAKLSVYPNPAQGSVTVSFSSAAAETVSLRLFDLKGSQLWIQQYEAHSGINTARMDCIRTLPDGIYILQWFDKLSPQQVKILVHH